MIELAHAKINLSLDIVCRRSDGYHELESIFLPLELHDILEITLAEENQIQCDEPGIPTDSSNLVWKAMNMIQTRYQRLERCHIVLKKRIPTMAGLGGGSSDAAATLRALNALLELHLSKEELIDLAKQLGADVPFFLEQKPAFVSGIGEVMEDLLFPFDIPVLLVKPDQGVSTKQAYETLCIDRCDHPNTKNIITAIQNHDYKSMVSMLGNSLEESAFRMIPIISDIKSNLRKMGFDAVLMSGSGSTVFAISRDNELINRGLEYYRKQGIMSLITRIKC